MVVETEKLPYLIKNRLTDAVANRFTNLVNWEVLNMKSEVIYEGSLDFDDSNDRHALADLSVWCYENNMMLLTFKPL